MNRVRILNVEPHDYCDRARRVLLQYGELTEFSYSRDQLLDRLDRFDVLIVRLRHQIDREVLDAAPRLQAIVTATTGVDHIDVEYARQKGVQVLSLRGETEFLRTVTATAEHTWTLLLALMRRLPQAFESVKDGEWTRDQFRGHELSGRRLGLVGFGRVGRQMARYGRAFDMAVATFDPYTTDREDGVQQADELASLLTRSDVVSLHVPLNVETQQMIGAGELRRLPRGAALVNTSRGEIIDETALAQALESGRLAGAALDVLAHERDSTLRRQSPLLRYARANDNLIVTPHIAGATCESMANTEVFMARKLAAFLSEHDLVSV